VENRLETTATTGITADASMTTRASADRPRTTLNVARRTTELVPELEK